MYKIIWNNESKNVNLIMNVYYRFKHHYHITTLYIVYKPIKTIERLTAVHSIYHLLSFYILIIIIMCMYIIQILMFRHTQLWIFMIIIMMDVHIKYMMDWYKCEFYLKNKLSINFMFLCVFFFYFYDCATIKFLYILFLLVKIIIMKWMVKKIKLLI
jgi:hypothetical protein